MSIEDLLLGKTEEPARIIESFTATVGGLEVVIRVVEDLKLAQGAVPHRYMAQVLDERTREVLTGSNFSENPDLAVFEIHWEHVRKH